MITKFYTVVVDIWFHKSAEYDITSHFESVFIKVWKTAENAASDGFWSNLGGAAFCLPHQLVGFLFVYLLIFQLVILLTGMATLLKLLNRFLVYISWMLSLINFEFDVVLLKVVNRIIVFSACILWVECLLIYVRQLYYLYHVLAPSLSDFCSSFLSQGNALHGYNELLLMQRSRLIVIVWRPLEHISAPSYKTDQRITLRYVT